MKWAQRIEVCIPMFLAQNMLEKVPKSAKIDGKIPKKILQYHLYSRGCGGHPRKKFAPKWLQGPANGPTWIYKPFLEHFYALKPSVLAHRNAPKMVCIFQLAQLLNSKAIFGGSITEIRDSLDFEGKMLKPRKPLTERSRVIIFF